MRKALLIFFVIILLLIFMAHNNSNPKIIISKLLMNSENIKTGGLRYRIYLLGLLPIGEATLDAEKVEEYKGQKVYHLKATGQISKLFSKLFASFAILDSYVDKVQLNPIAFKQKLLVMDKPDKNTEILYDQKNNIMSINGTERNVSPNTQDPLSALFNIKHMDFDKVKEFTMNFNTNQTNYILEGTVTPKDITIGKAVYKTYILQVELKRRNNNPYHQSSISMVLIKDKENIPILIRIFAAGVLINAKLVDIK